MKARWTAVLLLLLLLFSTGARLHPLEPVEPAGRYVPGELLVGLHPKQVRLASASRVVGRVGQVVRQFPALHACHVRLRPGLSVPEALAWLEQQDEVEYAEPNSVGRLLAVPDDPHFPQRQYAPQLTQAVRAWDIWQPQRQVVIGILDTGIDVEHPDLKNVLHRDATGAVIGYDTLDRGQDLRDLVPHGTGVAGAAAAQINNGLGMAGIAGWNPSVPSSDTFVRLMPIRMSRSRIIAAADIVDGMLWAVDHGAQVLNMSFTVDSSTLLTKSIQLAWERGCVLVAGAGNDADSRQYFPTDYENTLSVAWTDSLDLMSRFTSYGGWVGVAAPGEKMLTTFPNRRYAAESGTSLSAPLVAAEAALIMAQNPRLSNHEVRQIILSHVDPYRPYYDRKLAPGGGRINIYRALQAAGNGTATLTSMTLNPLHAHGGRAAQATVFLGGPAPPGGLEVALTNSHPAAAQVPERITVPEGAVAAAFNVPTRQVETATDLTVTAAFGEVTRTASLTVLPPSPAALTVSTREPTGGTTVTGRVTLGGPAPAGGVPVKLSSENTAATVPSGVTVAPGATSASFSIVTHPVSAHRPLGIAASVGLVTEEFLMTVLPAVPSSLAVSPGRVVGGTEAIGTVELTGLAPESGLPVALRSSHAAAKVPGTVRVAGGERQATFSITTTAVTTPTEVRISAIRGGETRSGTLTVTP